MCEFGNHPWKSSVVGAGEQWVRLASWYVPAQIASQGDATMAVIFAVWLGAMVGWSRLWSARRAQALVANREGLTVAMGFQTQRIPWTHVLAVETWHRFKWLDYAAVHYRDADQILVVGCWEQFGNHRLRSFVRACAEGVAADSEPTLIRRAGLRDRAIWACLLRRFAVDVTGATLLGYFLGVPGHAFMLGLVSASLSTLLACARHPLTNLVLVQKGGEWWRYGARETAPLRALPRSLRIWARSLEVAPRAAASAAK